MSSRKEQETDECDQRVADAVKQTAAHILGVWYNTELTAEQLKEITALMKVYLISEL